MTVTAAQAIQNFKNNPNIAPQAVADSAANVASLLDGLQTLTAAGKLQSIAFTDATPPTLSLTAAQLTSDAGTLAKIYANPNPDVYISDVSANGIPVGSDTLGNGTASSPYATIAKAEANVLPGQTILLNGLAVSPTSYAASTLTASNTTIDSVQAYGAEITGTGSTDLYILPKAAGTITVGRVIIDAGDAQADAVRLTSSTGAPYSVVFNGTRIENFTSLGVYAEVANVSATFSGATLSSSAGVRSAIYFGQMASGALDVENTTINIKQNLDDYGAIFAGATQVGPAVHVNNSNISVTSIVSNASGGIHSGIELINIHGAIIKNNAISIDASASPGWGAIGVNVGVAYPGQALDGGDFIVANNTVNIETTASGTAIEIGEDGDQASTRGLLNGGLVYGNTVSAPANQKVETTGIFVGSAADTDVYGNNVSGLALPLLDKEGFNSVFYGNTASNATLDYLYMKGSDHTTFVNNNLFMGDGMYNAYGLHVGTDSFTGDATSKSIVSGNSFISTAGSNPLFVQVDAGQGVDLSADTYSSTAPLDYESWQWMGHAEGSYSAWQSASQERGGSYTPGSGQGGALNAYPLPINTIAALTPGENLSSYGLSVTGVTAANATRTAATTGVIGVAVLDSAAHVGGGLDDLEAVANAGELVSITFTDRSTPTLSVGAATLINDAAAVGAIVGPYRLSVAGAMKALQATKLAPPTLAHLASGLTIQDNAVNVTSDLDDLQTLAAAHELGPIDLTDPATPTLSITASQLIGDGAALADIQGVHDLLLNGPINNLGTIVLGASAASTGLLVGAAGVTLTGGGQIFLGTSGKNSIQGVSATAVLTDVGNVIAGAGDVGGGELTLVNGAAAIIVGEDAVALVIDTGANSIVNAGRIENSGTGGTIVQSAVANSGSLIAEGGTLTLNGAITGSGDALIYGGTLNFTSSFSQNVGFKALTGVLELAQSQSFAGTVYAFSKTGGTSLDLRDIAFGGSTKATYGGTAGGGVLTVTDGTHTTHIKLSGNYLTSAFIASSDGQGGTSVIDPPKGAGAPATASLLQIAPPSLHGLIAAMANLGASPPNLTGAALETRHASSPVLAIVGRSHFA